MVEEVPTLGMWSDLFLFFQDLFVPYISSRLLSPVLKPVLCPMLYPDPLLIRPLFAACCPVDSEPSFIMDLRLIECSHFIKPPRNTLVGFRQSHALYLCNEVGRSILNRTCIRQVTQYPQKVTQIETSTCAIIDGGIHLTRILQVQV